MAAEAADLHENLPAFQVLVDAGCHLDMATYDGDTVLNILRHSLQHAKDSSHLGYSAPPYYASLLNTVFPLSCFCARVIREHSIPFDGGRLPVRLQEFVSRHRATEGEAFKKIILIACSIVYVNFLMFLFLFLFSFIDSL